MSHPHLVTSLGCLTALLSAPAAMAQAIWHVDDGPADPLEDGSAVHPFDAIQEAIDASVTGDTVLVADGTYTGTGNRDMSFGGRDITVRSGIIDCQGIASIGRIDMGAYEHGIGDSDCNATVNQLDAVHMMGCMNGIDGGPYDPGCEYFDFEYDGDVDVQDFAGFQRVFMGP